MTYHTILYYTILHWSSRCSQVLPLSHLALRVFSAAYAEGRDAEGRDETTLPTSFSDKWRQVYTYARIRSSTSVQCDA